MLTDTILERVESKLWVWEISKFRARPLFFVDRAVGRWTATPCDNGKIRVVFAYDYYPTRSAYRLLTRLLIFFQVKGMLTKALNEIKTFAESEVTMLYC